MDEARQSVTPSPSNLKLVKVTWRTDVKGLFQSEAKLDLEVVSCSVSTNCLQAPSQISGRIRTALFTCKCHRMNTQFQQQIRLSISQGWAKNKLISTGHGHLA